MIVFQRFIMKNIKQKSRSMQKLSILLLIGILTFIFLSSSGSGVVHYCNNFTENRTDDFTCAGDNYMMWSPLQKTINFTMVDTTGCYWNMSPKITNNFTIVMNESVNLEQGKAVPQAICDGDTTVGTYCAGVGGDGFAIGYNTEAADRFYSYNGDNIYGNGFSNDVYYNWTIFINATGDHAELYIDGGFEFATTAAGTLNDFKWLGWFSPHTTAGTFVISHLCIADTQDECSECLAIPPILPDTATPTYSNFQNNGTVNTFLKGAVNFSVDLEDNEELSTYQFAHNQTGSMINGSLTSISGSTFSVDEELNITLSPNNFICGQFTFNDTSGNINQTNLTCFSVQTASYIDLLFSNSSEFKSLFGETEFFNIYINWSDYLGNALDDSVGACNVSIFDSLVEQLGTNDNFTLCASGCDFSTYNDSFTFDSVADVKRDIAHAYVCNEQLQQDDATINISCGANSYLEIRDGATIPLCSEGVAFVTVNTSVCISSLDVNLSVTYNGTIQRRKRVTNIAMDREFSVHIGENGSELLFNTTLNLWKTNHTFKYYEHGIKYISGNCTHNFNSAFNNSVTETITIVNAPPQIFISQVNNTGGLFNLTENIEIANYTGIWEWFIIVLDDDMITVNYTFYNSSNAQKQSNQSVIPLSIKTPNGFFNPAESSYNITVWANDTIGNRTEVSLLFNITSQDTTAPIINLTFPDTNNDTFGDINIYINFSVSENSNCSVNNTFWTLQFENDTFFSFLETTATDGLYNVLIECNDSAIIPNLGTYIANFTKDTTIPDIISIFPQEDNSSLLININTITINWSATDNIRLFFYNLTITQNSILRFNSSGFISGTSYRFTQELNTAEWLNDTTIETLEVCDGHTSLIIPDATGIIKDKNKLTFQFGDTLIKVRSINGHEKETDTEKKKDRYTFKFYYDQPTTSKTFKLTANKKIIYLPDSQFKGHFIIGKNWVDFDTQYDTVVEQGDYDNETGGYDYFIYIIEDSDYIEIDSVGFLNCVTEVYSFELLSEELSIYNIRLLAGNFFNNTILDTSTTAGVLMFFFLFICLIALVIFSEYTATPAIMLFTAIYAFFFALLIFVSISIILGIVFVVLSFAYMFRSIVFAA